MHVSMATTLAHLKSSPLALFVLCGLLSNFAVAQDNEAPATTESAMVADGAPMKNEPEVNVNTKYSCSLNGLIRRIEINYTTENSTVPCDVNYYKDSEAPNEVNTLWSAQNLTGYCEQKVDEFVGKLRSWGWKCIGL